MDKTGWVDKDAAYQDMSNKADTEADTKTADKTETGAYPNTADEVVVRTRRQGLRWTERRWAALTIDIRGGENGGGRNEGTSPRRGAAGVGRRSG